jgi:6-phospho-3-hexuloisomerase
MLTGPQRRVTLPVNEIDLIMHEIDLTGNRGKRMAMSAAEERKVVGDFAARYATARRLVVEELDRTLASVEPAPLDRFVRVLLAADKVFFVGVGRVMLSLQAIAKRFAHLGIDTHCVGEITEPAIAAGDLLVVGSGSGSTLFPLAIARKAKALGATVVHMGSNPTSDLKGVADFMVRIPVRTKLYLDDEIDSGQPMTSLFEQALLLLGDIVAMMIIDERKLDLKGLWRHHANLE